MSYDLPSAPSHPHPSASDSAGQSPTLCALQIHLLTLLTYLLTYLLTNVCIFADHHGLLQCAGSDTSSLQAARYSWTQQRLTVTSSSMQHRRGWAR